MNYINLFSEIYLFVSFFILFTINIFVNLSKKNNFPNIYKFSNFLIIIFILNGLIIDIWNNIEGINSYDLYKNSGDIVVKLIISLLTIIFFIYSYFYIDKMKLNFFEYSLTIYFVLLSFSFFILTTDLLSFYLLLEIQSFCFYLLTAFNKYNQYSVESGLKYFILSSFSSVSLLFGYSFIYGLTGTFNFSDIYLFFSILSIDNELLYNYSILSLLILIAFLFKLYVAPFHLWVSDIYQGAPTITTAFFGTITTFPLFYVFIKFFISFFYWVQPYLVYLISILSILSMILGLFGALYQKKIKRLIAFSSVSTIGYLIIGFIQENPQSISYSITYFLLYMLNLTGIFIIFLNLYLSRENFFLERLVLLSGFIFRNKWISLSIVILFFTAAGIPPFSLFLAKILILTGLSYNFYSILLFILVFSAITSGFYYLRVIKYMSFNIMNQWIYISNINYINNVFILYTIFISLFFWWDGSKFLLLSDYILLSIY